MRVAITQRTLRLRTPIETSYGRGGRARRCSSSSSRAPTACRAAARRRRWSPTTASRASARARRSRPTGAVLEDGDGLDGGELLDACRAADDLPQALAAVDLALWDRAGPARRACRSRRCWPTRRCAEVAVNATIGACDRAGAARGAAAARGGGLSLREAQGRHRRRRGPRRRGARGARPRRARCAWTPTARGRSRRRCGRSRRWRRRASSSSRSPSTGWPALRAVRERVAVRIAMDETAAEPGALASGAADAVCLKLGRCGGISGLLAAATLVRATGAEPYVASTFDGPLGIAAALHARRRCAWRRRAAWRRSRCSRTSTTRRVRIAVRGRAWHRRAATRAGADALMTALELRIARSLLRRAARRATATARSRTRSATCTGRAGAGPHPVAVVLHGGYWQPPYTKLIMRPLCHDLARRGYAALERRVPPARPRRRRLADDVRRRRGGDRPARRRSTTRAGPRRG